MGATTAVFDPSEVEELGKFSERWRFDYPHLAKPREHSFGLATATDPQDSGGAAWAATEAASGSGLQPLEVVPPKKSEQIFKAVPFSTVDRSWKVCGRYKWKRAEPFPVLEARASLFAIKHAARNIECFGKRLLVLSDSISAVCALDKGRGRSFKMRRVSQQVAAMCLGANLQVCYRWLPSEWNPADGPSRGSIFPSKPVRFPLASHDTPVSGDRSGAAKQKHSCIPQQQAQDSRDWQEEGLRAEAQEEETTAGSSRVIGRGISVNQMQGYIQGLLGSVDAVQQDASESEHPTSNCGSVLGSHAESHVRGRGGSEHGAVHGGGSSLPPASLEGPKTDVVAKGETVTAGMAKAGPTEVSFTSALGDSCTHDSVCHEEQPRPRGSDDGNVLCALPQTWRSVSPEEQGLGPTAEYQGRSQPNLECSVASDRVGGGIQDLRIRRDCDLRREGAQLHPSGGEQMEKLQTRTKEQPLVHINSCAAENGDGEGGKGRELRSSGATTSIPAQTWRGKSRFCPGQEEAQGDPAKGALEDLFQRPPLRKRGKTESIVTRTASLGASKMHQGRRQLGKDTPMPALSISRSLTVAVFLKIFSGVGNLSRSMASVCGCYVLMWDITLGPEYDLRSPAKRRLIGDWVRSGLILGFHLGTPCEGFTRARDFPPGPPPLRSDSQPLGLHGLKPHDQVKVAVGNLWMRFSVWLLLLGLRFQVRGTMENPARSRLWLCPPVLHLLRQKLVTWVETHYCAWGKPYKKPTGFLCVCVVTLATSSACCVSVWKTRDMPIHTMQTYAAGWTERTRTMVNQCGSTVPH